MTARITINLSTEGELELWLNPEGRDLLVRELQGLSERNDLRQSRNGQNGTCAENRHPLFLRN